MKRTLLAALAVLTMIPSAFAEGENYQSMVASHAAANGVPVSLVHRVIMRESRYNPRAVSKGNYGMMQIRLQTARGMGYTGNAQGLLDPETNLTYAVKYLAGAYRVAGGNENRAVRNYAAGYYYAAKRQGLVDREVAQTQPDLFATQPSFGERGTFGERTAFGEQPGFGAQPLFGEPSNLEPGVFNANARMTRHRHGRHHHRHFRRHRRG